MGNPIISMILFVNALKSGLNVAESVIFWAPRIDIGSGRLKTLLKPPKI